MDRGDELSGGTARGAEPAPISRALRAGRAVAWTLDGATFTCSGAVPELLGREPASAEELAALVHEADRAGRSAAIAAAAATSGEWVLAFRTAADPARWIEERGSAWREADGRVALAALAHDTTVRKREEASLAALLQNESRARHAAEDATETAEAAVGALARSEAFLESIFVAMTDGLVVFDARGRPTRLNPAARAMLHCGEAEGATAVEERLARLELHDVEGRPLPLDALPVSAALRGEVARGVPVRIRVAGGETLWANVGAAPILAHDGRALGAVMTLGDVTLLRQLQEQREDLSRTISHDLRTPLNVILAQAKLLGRRVEMQDGIRARGEIIARAAQHMAALLTDLVESALLEAGKLRLDLATVDVAALAHELQRGLAAAYGERIRVEASASVLPIVADAARVERVLANLLTNALKYSAPESEVVLRLADGVEALTICVEDRGAGIAPEDLPRLFERWFRAGAQPRPDGMGLGLYTTRMLVEAHGGTIGVATEAGKGSVFRVRLPRTPTPPGR